MFSVGATWKFVYHPNNAVQDDFLTFFFAKTSIVRARTLSFFLESLAPLFIALKKWRAERAIVLGSLLLQWLSGLFSLPEGKSTAECSTCRWVHHLSFVSSSSGHLVGTAPKPGSRAKLYQAAKAQLRLFTAESHQQNLQSQTLVVQWFLHQFTAGIITR